MNLFRIRKNTESHPIIVSLDCQHNETLQVAKDFGEKIKTIIQVMKWIHSFFF